MSALGVKIKRDGVRRVEHGDTHHVSVEFGHDKAIETEGERFAWLMQYFKVVAEDFGQWMFAELAEQCEIFAHVSVAHVGKNDRAVVERAEIAIVVYPVKKFGRILEKQSARVGFLEALEVQLFGDVKGCDFHNRCEYRFWRGILIARCRLRIWRKFATQNLFPFGSLRDC